MKERSSQTRLYHTEFGYGRIAGADDDSITAVFGGRRIVFERPLSKVPGLYISSPDPASGEDSNEVPEDLLRRYYGYDSFKPGQREIIDNISHKNDVMCIMPTGAGKSVCYQIPALMMDGVTIVISPLISLMKDQVEALNEDGISAAYINSSLSPREYFSTIDGMRAGLFDMVYVAPERLNTENFLDLCRSINIPFVAVDEAHCISQWGQDFRPSYLEIADFIGSLPERPVVGAFTATATMEVRSDIVRVLGLDDPYITVTGFDRPNLSFSVFNVSDKYSSLLSLLKKYEDRSGIIYCSTRKNVDMIYSRLKEEGISAGRYHAGLDSAERRKNQDDFIHDRIRVIAATNAFGMGIDKSDVSFVIHYNMPKSIENYYQEAGRAGRDGSDADCILLYSAADVETCRFMIRSSEQNPLLSPEEQDIVRKRDLERLKQMTFYSTTTDCLRGFILRYFGEWAPPECGNCSNCLKEHVRQDITEDAAAIIRCIMSTGQRFGIAKTAAILKASSDSRTSSYRMTENPFYGKLRDHTLHFIRNEINTLIAKGYLSLEGDEYPVLKLTGYSSDILNGVERLSMKVSVQSSKVPSERRTAVRGRINKAVYSRLKEFRAAKAKVRSIPAYVVFNDRTLEELSIRCPVTREELLGVSGIGENKADLYGKGILDIIKKTADE